MKKSLKTFRDLSSRLSYADMQALKGGQIDEIQCHQDEDLECNEYTNPEPPPNENDTPDYTNAGPTRRKDVG